MHADLNPHYTDIYQSWALLCFENKNALWAMYHYGNGAARVGLEKRGKYFKIHIYNQ